MKATDPFKRTIQAYLEQYSTTDELFAESLKKPSKNIDDCITYIFFILIIMGKHSKKPIEQRLSIWQEEQLSKQRAKEALLLAKKQEEKKQKNLK